MSLYILPDFRVAPNIKAYKSWKKKTEFGAPLLWGFPAIHNVHTRCQLHKTRQPDLIAKARLFKFILFAW
jgi:hypothetical protein